jgi:hypothetical protein
MGYGEIPMGGWINRIIAVTYIACSAQACSTGQSLDRDGAPVEGDHFALADQSCPTGQVATGIGVDGTLQCTDQPAPVATSCEADQYMTGVDESGGALCAPVPFDLTTVREYINANCFIYLGWRDSCDGCVDIPVKLARTHGDGVDCQTNGSNGGCQPFTVFGETVRMASVNTDGDVNDDDKFWVGLKCGVTD